LAFGDSLTRGIGAARGRSYPDELARLSGRRVVNRGVPGEISADGARRLPDVLQRVVPDLLVLCHGGNDMLRKLDPSVTEANLRSMIETARARGVPVVLLGVPRPGVLLQSPAFYQELAEAYGLPYQGSVLGDVLGDRTLKADLIHPNATGYRRLAQAIHTLLVEAGAL
jgi:lysophospholipase L1-like esterase